MNSAFFAKWRNVSVKHEFWLHMTSDENIFYMEMYLREISYPISTPFGCLEFFRFSKIEKET
jgi:hypothetical protein